MKNNRGIIFISLTLMIVLILAGCGSESSRTEMYTASSALFSSDYNTDELYHSYNTGAFALNGQTMTYTDTENYVTQLGIDVSEHNGEIDWEQVRDAGYEFVFIRIGYRGYGEDGTLVVDSCFEDNYRGAVKAGLDVGVYFFGQAIDEEEAEEEAQFVADTLDGRELQLPVVYDVESIEYANARTDSVSGDQHTANIKAFCLKIVELGYNPMLYTNLSWETFILNMRELYDLPIWYSEYGSSPMTSYSFDIWQYSSTGVVDGIEGDVDLNIQMIPAEMAEDADSVSESS